MKKILLKSTLLCALLILSANVNAQVLGNIIKNVVSSSKSSSSDDSSDSSSSSSSSSSSGSSLLSSLTSIFSSSNVATEEKIIGTWVYQEPAVVISSDNALKNLGGKVASSAVESELKTQFEKLGIKEGAITMVFDDSGNFTQTISGKTMTGTYTIEDDNINLKYGSKLSQIIGTTQLDGNNLLIVMDATKLLSFVNLLGSLSNNSLLESATSLLGSMDGMEVGFKLTKQ